ncbi:Hint domain-containing protein [Rhodobacter aestuarii]|uniref:Hint domain-containing protein n=1 Tax=Rhodobacter aestuarii TaxID=453582 RepID=A0A1N7NRC6_9RHOB|nr:Hint domain-containing protein [Rhodobacter aestuarii]PTV94594.1 Hint domain-containing protein [Rhodobacter aestuarii]SIT00935.1 Hint domain-containing protein [Rhodobacter aestuarii]
MPTFGAWQLSDLIISGPDPFGSNAVANPDTVGATTFTINPAASLRFVTLSDDDSIFEDADGDQELVAPMVFDGVSYGSGGAGDVETEYSYVVRPVGSNDPADNITIYVLEFEGDVHGIASSERLLAGRDYQIVAIESDDPTVAYTAMAVCFAAGTLIATRRGPKPVETLQPGDKLQTSDNGFRPVDWVGRWRVNGRGRSAPVRIAPGVLNNDRALYLSGQHRVLLRPTAGPLVGEEVLVAAKTLVGLPGITRLPCKRIEWVHVLMPEHEVIFAENARAESLLAGPRALSLIEPQQAQALRRELAEDPLHGLPARPIVPPAKVERMILSYRGGKGPAAVAGLKLTLGT